MDVKSEAPELPPPPETTRNSNLIREDDAGNEANLPHGFRLVVIFTSLVLSIALVALDFTIVATAIPRITDEFHSLDQVGWYGSSYFLTNCALQAMWGKAYSYFDLQRVFVLGIAIFEVGTLICATSQSSEVFILGRAVAGFGGAALGSGAFTIVAAIATPRKRAMYIGFMGSVYGVASVVGPILGGVFTEFVTWRWCFWINLPVGGLASTMVLFFFQSPPREVPAATRLEQVRQMDLLGAAPLLASLVCYLLPMRWGGVAFAWGSPQVLGTLIGAGVLGVSFIGLEWWSGEWAMLQTRFFKQGEIVLNFLYMYFLSGLYMPAIYFLSIQFQAIGNETPARAGIQLIPLALCVSFGTIVANTCITKYGYPSIWLVSGPVLATAGAAAILACAPNASTAEWIGFQVVLGFGVGFSLQTPISLNQSLVETKDIAIIVAMTLFFEEMGACMLVSAAQAAFSNKLVSVLAAHDPSIDPLTVVEAGASQLRNLFNPQELEVILAAYQEGLTITYALFLTCGGITTALSLTIARKEVQSFCQRRRKQKSPTDEKDHRALEKPCS